ncbi:MAG: sigma-70 family RNA polymerase sigma factor [Bacteroidaceae bacterium]|nr:sigma-70 family RNA polymerase sigma factor [Bacteroidaceae bacterium]
MTSKEFEEKYVRLAPRLYQVAMSMLNNQQDAEDVVQETLVKLWREADRLEHMQNPLGYMLRTLRNACIDLLRSRPNEMDLEPLEETIAEPDVSPELDVGKKVQIILHSLPQKTQQIINMRHVAECSIDEICEATGETPSNIRQILSRTRRKIVEQIKIRL